MKKKKRVSRFVRVARLAYELSKQYFAKYSHRNSPKRYTQPQLAACVLLTYYLNLSYRDMEEWLLASDQVCQELELESVPDHTTLYRMYKKMLMRDYEALNNQLLTSLGIEEEAISIDATGLSMTRASQHYLSRSGRKLKKYVKAFYCVPLLDTTLPRREG